jgi:hypothetical protein
MQLATLIAIPIFFFFLTRIVSAFSPMFSNHLSRRQNTFFKQFSFG